ncbi:hypothetical protein BKA70DRAFT_1221762 [Coprinopsis sp. MPI-PUGE-AT-0042]|nr:hypothetical protein BKA70DRAFT_1221762 [Coprinopsis sp. MPI-PUGE-AT-0042]
MQVVENYFNDPISKTFLGVLNSQIACHCGYNSPQFEPGLELGIKECTIFQLKDDILQYMHSKPGNWKCKSKVCKNSNVPKQIVTFTLPPKLLIITLKHYIILRLDIQQLGLTSASTKGLFHALHKLENGPGVSPVLYDLYISYAHVDSKWYNFNNGRVKEIDKAIAMANSNTSEQTKQTYILVYWLQEELGPSDPTLHASGSTKADSTSQDSISTASTSVSSVSSVFSEIPGTGFSIADLTILTNSSLTPIQKAEGWNQLPRGVYSTRPDMYPTFYWYYSQPLKCWVLKVCANVINYASVDHRHMKLGNKSMFNREGYGEWLNPNPWEGTRVFLEHKIEISKATINSALKADLVCLGDT